MKSESEHKPEIRHQKPDYGSEVSLESAQSDVERSFPNLRIADINYLGSGRANTAYLVNNKVVFRFAKHQRGSAGLEREKKTLDMIRGCVSVPIPIPIYQGVQAVSGLNFLGHEMLRGKELSAAVIKTDEKMMKRMAAGLGKFIQELHSIDYRRITDGPTKNTYEKEKEKLENARTHLFPVLDELYPAEAAQIKAYIENLIAQSIEYRQSEDYKPTLLHGDLEAEHILYNPNTGEISGIIDWGGTEIGDPDYELWRLYSHYGIEFIDEFLKSYPHPDRDKLLKKCEFFYRAQIVRRAVRPLEDGDTLNAPIRIEWLRKQALGLGYWYGEIL